MKNLIKSEQKRRNPAKEPALAISSARLFSLCCNGVFSASPRGLVSHVTKGFVKLQHTHHDSSFETLRPNCDNDVHPFAIQNLASAGERAARMREVRVSLAEPLHTILERHFLDSIGLARGSRFITFDVMAPNEHIIARDDLAWLKKRYVAHNYLLTFCRKDSE